MEAVKSALVMLPACVVGLIAHPSPPAAVQAADPPPGRLTTDGTALGGSAIAALVEANGGKPPAIGEELWRVLTKLGKFAQLPVVFSAVRLDSGIGNPRVVIAPVIDGLSNADVTKPNLDGRLYLAANMERGENGGDPRVTSVEFISWNSQRRQFDFGMIENMGGGEPELRIVDGGKCFSCHKNRGPILGVAPWTDSTHHSGFRTLVGERLGMVATVPPGPARNGLRSRVDGMALVAPEAATVDDAVRIGAILELNRETIRLMNRFEVGRMGFVGMLVAVTEPGPLKQIGWVGQSTFDRWGNDKTYQRFASEWVSLGKTKNTGMLIDFAPIPRPLYEGWGRSSRIIPVPPPPAGGFPTQAAAKQYQRWANTTIKNNERITRKAADKLTQLATYDAARAAGVHGMTSVGQPSNPKAFVQPAPRAAQRPSGMVNPLMLAGTIGLTEGDRSFLARTLNEAVERVNKPKATATVLARAVFEGPEFADVLAGGPLPDRDEFKDRFVAGLQQHLKSQYPFTQGIPIKRSEYASGPAYDPKAVEDRELVIAPTTACLRCHEVRASSRRAPFEVIPPLAFDPLDKAARESWVRTTGEKRRLEVLSRFAERLNEDKDMPPEDSPEHALFRVKEAEKFDELKRFLISELARVQKK